MGRVEAHPGAGNLFTGDGQVDAAAVEADRFDRGGAFGSEPGEERCLGTLLAGPDNVAGAVVGDDGVDCFPGAAQQPADACLCPSVVPASDHVLEVGGMSRRR